MIEMDGAAIPLEPGKYYLLVYDVNRIDPKVMQNLWTFADGSGVKIALVPVSGSVDAVRIVQVEETEKVESPLRIGGAYDTTDHEHTIKPQTVTVPAVDEPVEVRNCRFIESSAGEAAIPIRGPLKS